MTQTYKIQVSMNQAHLVESGFVFKQGDFGFNIEIEVLDFDATGSTPQIIFRKSAGAVEATTITVSGNKYTYTMRGTELDTPGPAICDLKLKNSTTQRISTASFKFFVIPDTEDGLNQQASSYSDTIAQIVDGFEDQVADVSNSLGQYENYVFSNYTKENLLLYTKWTEGGYIVPSTGAITPSSGYSYSDYIPITGGNQYRVEPTTTWYYAFYDSSKAYVSGGQVNTNYYWNPASNVAFVRISLLSGEAGNGLLRPHPPVVQMLNPNIKVSPDQIISTHNIITVATNGSKMYTSLRTALESITESGENNRYIVEFYGDGTEYDATDDYTAEEIASVKGLTVPSYTTLKGIGGKEKCIISARLTSQTSNRYFSALSLDRGASIEGLTVIGEYSRNVIHQDFGTLTNLTSTVKDCHLIGINLNLAYVLAAGLASGCTFNYENTVFENRTAGGYAYSCHNNSGFADSGFLYFDNCKFIVNEGTTDFSFRLGSITNDANGINCNCILTGCDIPVQLRLNQENTSVYGAGILWKVTGYANNITDVKIYNTDETDYSGNVQLEVAPAVSASGNPLVINTKYEQFAQNEIISLKPTQDLHGYDKPWPAGGGKNLFPLTVANIKSYSGTAWDGNSCVIQNVTFTILTDDAGNVTGIRANGTAQANATLVLYGKSTSTAADLTFASDVKVSMGYSGSSQTVRGVVWGTSGATIDDSEVSVSANSSIYGFGLRVVSGYNAQNIVFYPMIRLASGADSSFAPYTNICPISGVSEIDTVSANGSDPTAAGYKHKDLTIQIGQTVHGGSLNLKTGVLTVNRAIVDMGDLNWTLSSGAFWVNISGKLTGRTSNEYAQNPKISCSCFKTSNNLTGTEANSIRSGYTGTGQNVREDNRVVVFTSGYADAAAFKTAMEGQKLVYPLATPATIQLAPHSISLLKGYNYITTNCDNISLSYVGESASLDGLLDSQILTDTATGDKYKLKVTDGVLSIEQI